MVTPSRPPPGNRPPACQPRARFRAAHLHAVESRRAAARAAPGGCPDDGVAVRAADEHGEEVRERGGGGESRLRE